MRKKSIIAVALALGMSLVCFAGCGRLIGGEESASQTNTDPQSVQVAEAGVGIMSGGVLLLSVNPQLAIEYNEAGLVTEVSARNDEAIAIISRCEGLIGGETRSVVSKLVIAIGEAGYFVDNVEGSGRQITIEIEDGSQLPSQTFFNEVVSDVQTILTSRQWTNSAGEVPDQSIPQPSVNVIVPQGTQISGGTQYVDTDYGPDNDGVTDYGVTINPADGSIIGSDTDYGPDNDGVTDYADTDYGPNNDGVTDYADTDYGPNNDGVTDYADTDYGPNNDGVTDYSSGASDYDDGNSGYGNSDYGDSGYDD